ncbi:MAG TPA: glycosyltransferase [Pseudonocardiaceae bacterium]|jgi:UDP:flavonoid glycosyltransferase YjiC (YdhE family)|nr:glycosyltransferase [Pseudonocardiaceae bacterium]
MTRVAIATIGTRGDVAPLTGVGVALREAGHEVILAAPSAHAEEITGAGLEFRAIGGDVRESDLKGANLLRLLTAAIAPSVIRWMANAVVDALKDDPADVLLLTPFAEFGGLPLAEARGIPSIGLRFQPLSTTAAHPPSVLGSWSAGRAGNRMAGAAGGALVDRLYGGVIADVRKQLGLPSVPARALRRQRTEAGWPIMNGYSPTVVPRPSDWRGGLDVVGYWWPHVDPAWQPPSELVDFLAAGPPPVFLGFGSFMTSEKTAARLSEHALTALRAAGVRGVVQAGWANLQASGDDVLTIGEAPHEWLFPRMAAVVHACGAGTTAAGLRAGVPAIGVPVAGDQAFWARRLRELGVSTATVSYWRVNAERLTAAIRDTVSNPALKTNAEELAARMAKEDGAAAVVDAVENLLS